MSAFTRLAPLFAAAVFAAVLPCPAAAAGSTPPPPKADLSLTATLASHPPILTTDTVQLTATIKNLGPDKATLTGGAPLFQFGLRAAGLNTYVLPSTVELAMGQEYTATLTVPPFATKPGRYNLEVSIASSRTYVDSYKTNNIKSVAVTVTAPAGSAPSQPSKDARPSDFGRKVEPKSESKRTSS